MSPWGVRFRWGAVTLNCSDQAQGYVELQDYVEMQGYASCDVAKLRWNAKCKNEAQGDDELQCSAEVQRYDGLPLRWKVMLDCMIF